MPKRRRYEVMNAGKATEFIKRKVDFEPLRVFEACVTIIADSVVAFAYGTHKDGAPNPIGTGFNVANLDDKAGLFATCLHVMEEIKRLSDLSADELRREGLIDKKRYIASLNKSRYEWREVGPIKFSDKIQIDGKNLLKVHDVCICRIPKIILPSLSLSPDEYFMGSELGIVGFPNFEHLQKLSVQPYALKTILSSHMRYPFEIEYVFSFDEIPGRDNGKLIDFLNCRFGIDWRKCAIFEKIDDGKTIKISTEKNSLLLKLNDEETEAILEIDDGRINKFRAMMENDRLTIYEIKESERIALDCMAGKGFSGSPVFSIRDGNIVGMVDYLPTELRIEDLKITGTRPIEGDIRVHYAAGISVAVPSKLIQKCLECALKCDWEKSGEQTYTI